MKLRKPLLAFALLISLAIPAFVSAEDVKKADQSKPYPLTTCLVSGEKLGEMGKPFIYQHEGREVRFCCKNCLKDFKKDPAKYLKKLDEAEKAGKK